MRACKYSKYGPSFVGLGSRGPYRAAFCGSCKYLSRDNQGGKRDNQDGKFFDGVIFEDFGSDLTR